MRHIDLFSGIGGFALAASRVWGEDYHNIGHSEIEPFPCKIYHKHFPESECLGDVSRIDWKEGTADLVTGGFPCQPHSMAGKRKASADERDLWDECVRAVCRIRPSYAIFENVPGLLTSERGRFFNRVLSSLAEVGYDAEWQDIPAAFVGADHIRERIWIVAYPCKIQCEYNGGYFEKIRNMGECVGVEYIPNWEGIAFDWAANLVTQTKTNELSSFPILSGIDDGLPDRVDRPASLGNAIVPQVAAEIMKAIKMSEVKP